MRTGGPRLTALAARRGERIQIRECVCAALPPDLARVVVSAGIEQGLLTVGVARAAWATRLRYAADALREGVGGALGVDIRGVRIKIVPPRA